MHGIILVEREISMKYSDKDYEKHLASEHKLTAFSVYLREIVYGGNDGIVTTFAVVAGFTGASGGEHIAGVGVVAVLLFGLANLFADGASMGLGNLLSIRSQQDIYRAHKKRELKEIRGNPEMEKTETIHILKERGYSKKDAEEMTGLYMKNEEYWLEFMMKQELDMPDPEGDNPWLTGLATFLSFAVFGVILLLPYILLRGADSVFFISCVFTFFGFSFARSFKVESF